MKKRKEKKRKWSAGVLFADVIVQEKEEKNYKTRSVVTIIYTKEWIKIRFVSYRVNWVWK